ncbi:hypothetical protein AHF37_05389 [Paragonimus kellicotti]|nr:hypothetical protein AHF37_05389 [Paragonimus kellicotti]
MSVVKGQCHRIFLATTVVVMAIALRLLLWRNFTMDNLPVIKYLVRLESSYRPMPQRNPGPRVLVGFGGCVDLKVRAVPFLSALKWVPPNVDTGQLRGHNRMNELHSSDDVISSFTSAFTSGAAVERVIHNGTLFNEMVQVATNLVPQHMRNKFWSTITTEFGTNYSEPSPVAWLSLGGNALVMAIRLAREGAQVSLAARLSPRERANLPDNVKPITAPPTFGLPEVPEEDVHLILEYDAGERWGTLVAPRANRYIIIRDQESPRLSGLWPGLLETWQKAVSGAAAATRSDINKPLYPDLVVIGGLQLMDNWGFHDVPDIRSARLAELGMFLSRLPSETLVHFEMASFVNQVFANDMLRRILPHVDSIGLNEQELPNLASLLSNGTITSISSAYPRAAHMLDAMRIVWAFLNDPGLPRVSSASGPGWRRLSRIHLHTIAHQLIMVRRHARGGAFARKQLDAMINAGGIPVRRADIGLAWPFNRAAVAKASLIANRHTCASSAIDPVKTRLLMDDSFAVTADPQRWKSALYGTGDIGWDRRTPDFVPRIHFNATNPVTCWSEPEPDLTNTEELQQSAYFTTSRFETQIEICVAPVLVCSEVRQTVGAGDNISAGALRVQTTARSPG